MVLSHPVTFAQFSHILAAYLFFSCCLLPPTNMFSYIANYLCDIGALRKKPKIEKCCISSLVYAIVVIETDARPIWLKETAAKCR